MKASPIVISLTALSGVVTPLSATSKLVASFLVQAKSGNTTAVKFGVIGAGNQPVDLSSGPITYHPIAGGVFGVPYDLADFYFKPGADNEGVDVIATQLIS